MTSRLSLRTRTRNLARAGAALVVVTALWLSFRGFTLRRSLDALKSATTQPDLVRIDWSAGPAMPPGNMNYIHVHVPRWVSALYRDPSASWQATPFCQIDAVDMSNVDGEILGILGGCTSLRTLAIKRPQPVNPVQWNAVLRQPLEELRARNSWLPANALSQLADKGTIKSLLLAGEGPFGTDAAVSLGRCRSLESLYLENVKGLPDDELGREIRNLERLKRVDLWGPEFGERTITALVALPRLEEVWIVDSGLGPDLFAKLSDCRRLHTVCISRSAVDDTVLNAFMGMPTLKTCYLQDGRITSKAIQEFREKRPDVELTILGSLKFPNGRDE